MTEEQQKEQLSRAYLLAVAAMARISCNVPSVDDDSIDVCLAYAGEIAAGHDRSPRIEVQLKATAAPHFVDGGGALSLRIPRKNYDDLRLATTYPRVLMAMILPADAARWVEQTDEQLVSRRCMHWVNLNGAPFAGHSGDLITIHVPTSQTVTVESIRHMMLRVAMKERV